MTQKPLDKVISMLRECHSDIDRLLEGSSSHMAVPVDVSVLSKHREYLEKSLKLLKIGEE